MGRFFTHIRQLAKNLGSNLCVNALDLTLPQHCLLCSQAVDANDHTPQGWPRAICHWCLSALPGVSVARCQRCALPLPLPARAGRSGLSDSSDRSGQPDRLWRVCQACRANPPPFNATVVLADYAMPLDRLIQRFKYNGQFSLARGLGQSLVQAIGAPAGNPGFFAPAWPTRIIPVPLSGARLRERGFNQSELLARDIGRRLRLPVDNTSLTRKDSSASPSQTSKSRQDRFSSMQNQFIASDLTQQRIALVDDVMTSGATLRAAGRALTEAGASRVVNLVIARTR